MIRRPPRSTQSRSSAASDVYKRQALLQALGVDEHDGTDRTGHQVVPHEQEAVLAGRPEEVEPQVAGQRDATEVHRDGGGRLAVGLPCLLYTSPSPRDGL